MQLDTKPWYKQFWPWLLIAIPVLTALKAIYSVMLMQGHAPDMVVDDYYKEGQGINMQLALYREAEVRNLQATVLLAGNQIIVRFNPNNALDGELQLVFQHATLADQDFSLTAERSGASLYVATLPHTLDGKWQLVVSDASKQWKLRATLALPNTAEIRLGY